MVKPARPRSVPNHGLENCDGATVSEAPLAWKMIVSDVDSCPSTEMRSKERLGQTLSSRSGSEPRRAWCV